MKRLHGNVCTPDGFIAGHIEFATDSGRITAIDGERVAAADVRERGGPIILPGFIDTHVHGGGGRDIMEGGDAAAVIAAMHARHGTTAMLATTMTAPAGDLEAAFAGLRPHCRAPRGAGARILGVHLEGPYINPGKLGAQPAYARPVDTAEIAALHSLAPIRLVTLAPEVGGNIDAIATLTAATGCKVQIGHSSGSYDEGRRAMAAGADGFTHLFNAMTGLHHREPGMAGAALAHAEFAEIIPDLIHVHPGAIRTALRCIPRLFCVTDSTAAAGMPDGEYRLGRHTVNKCMGGVRMADGTLAGSVLTMDQALRNLVDIIGLALDDAARRVSTHAASYLGLSDRGRLVPGAFADLAVLDRDLAITDVIGEGHALQ